MSSLAETLYRVTDKGPLRALSLIMALLLAGCIFWNPNRFASHTSPLAIWQSLLVMWAVCCGVIHGVGFRPQRLYWRLFFIPLPAMLILAACLIYFFR